MTDATEKIMINTSYVSINNEIYVMYKRLNFPFQERVRIDTVGLMLELL